MRRESSLCCGAKKMWKMKSVCVEIDVGNFRRLLGFSKDTTRMMKQRHPQRFEIEVYVSFARVLSLPIALD